MPGQWSLPDLPIVSTIASEKIFNNNRTAVGTICISSVGRMLGKGVVFVAVEPTEKELNTNSQALEGK